MFLSLHTMFLDKYHVILWNAYEQNIHMVTIRFFGSLYNNNLAIAIWYCTTISFLESSLPFFSFHQSYKYIFYVPTGSVILALFLAGYLGQQYLPPPKPRVIGLDLGTTFCSVGVFHPGTGEIEVIEDDKGRKSIPSVVSFTPTGIFSGHEGQELSDINPQNTIYDGKRFIGKIFDKESLEGEGARYPFKVHISYVMFFHYSWSVSDIIFFNILQVIFNNGSAEFLVSTNSTFTVTPEFIGSRLLLKMRKMAEKQLGVPISKAVISVPAEFDERRRNYTIRAANLAGQFTTHFFI